jgi:YD repeat-containing protein
MTEMATETHRELAHRDADGIAVTLSWNERSNRVTVKVYDARSDDGFELDVDSDRALDAYRHPFAYAAADPL